jgi:hypothetical protein
MISATIRDAFTKRSATVDNEGALEVVVHPHPPLDESVYPLPYFQYFTDDGTSSGSNDMVINGGTTPTNFFISASEEYDIFVGRVEVRISDPNARLDRFGALTALSNGVEFFYETGETGRVQISENITTNLQFIRLAGGQPAFGSGTDAFKADIAGGSGEDTYLPSIDMDEIFNLRWGLRLRKGTTDKLGFLIQDNLTGISTFNIFGLGLRL